MSSIRTMGGLLTAAALAFCGAVQAQDAATFPNRTVRIVVPATAGGSADVIGRLLGDRLRQALGQSFVVENRPGAAQALGTAIVARAAPDGYTLLLGTMSALVLQPYTNRNVPYDTARDLQMVAHIGRTPLALFAGTTGPIATLQDMTRLAREKPGRLSYGSFGTGSSSHLLGEYFARQAGLTAAHVPYPGGQQAIADILAGSIDFAVFDTVTGLAQVKAGRLRALAVAGPQRSVSYPDVPTFTEQGIQGLEPFAPWFAILAPAGVPQPVVEKISTEILRILGTSEVTAQLQTLGLNVTAWPADRANAFMQDELAAWKRVLAQLPDVKLE